MDRLETWEIPFTSACERTGSSGSRSNNDPGLEGPSDLPGAQTARHEARRSAWTSEAKQISDRGCVAGSRSTPIGPVTSGNRTHRDPIEERGVPCGENRWRETRERTLSLTNLSTKRQRIAELARTQRGDTFEIFFAGELRIVSSTPPRARLSHEGPEAGNLHIRVVRDEAGATSSSTRPSQILATGSGRCRAAGNVALRDGAILSFAPGAHHCCRCRGWVERHSRPLGRSNAIGTARPAFCR